MTAYAKETVTSRPGHGGRGNRLADQIRRALAGPPAATRVTFSRRQQRAFEARTRRVDLIAARYIAAERPRTARGVHADD